MDTNLNIINTRLLCGLILYSVYFPIAWADHHKFPPVVKVGEGSLLVSEQIFPIANKPTKECHASTIVETSDGELVAAWFAGTRERDPDVGIWVSRKTGERWTEPVEVVNGVQSMNLRYPCWNPVLFQPSNGPLMLFYKVGPNPREWWGTETRRRFACWKMLFASWSRNSSRN